MSRSDRQPVAGSAWGLLVVLGLAAVSPPWRTMRWRWLALFAALLAASVNPYGPRLFTYIAHELFVPHPLTEWQPVELGRANAPFLLLTAALLVTLPFGQTLRRNPWWAALLALVVVMAFRHQRHAPLAALVGAAPLADQLDGLRRWLARRGIRILSTPARSVVAFALWGMAALQVGLLAERLVTDRARIVFAADDYPVGAVHFLKAGNASGNLALPLDWGGYVLWHLAPGVRVSLDGRFATVYPPAVVEDNFAFFRGAGVEADRLLDRYPTSIVLAPSGVTLPVETRPGWSPIYRDRVATLWANANPAPTVRGEAPVGLLPFP